MTRELSFSLTGLIAFMLLGSACQRAVTSRETTVNSRVSAVLEDTVGASSLMPPKGARTFDLKSPGLRDSLRGEIGRQRELWRASGMRQYRYLLRVSCFCPGPQGWRLIQFRDGQANNDSMDGLFDILTQNAERDDVVAVAFDDRWHYPTYIRTDIRLGLPDDWAIFQVRGLRPR